MIVQTSKAICFKCATCEKYVIQPITAFEARKGLTIACPCGKSQIAISAAQSAIRLVCPCSQCGNETKHTFDMQDFWSAEIGPQMEQVLLTCDKCGGVACSIGDETRNDLKEQLDKEMTHEKVLLLSLDTIRGMRLNNAIKCECGKLDLNIKLGLRGIDLCCRRCGARKLIMAVSKESLAKLRSLKNITLMKNNEKVIKIES